MNEALYDNNLREVPILIWCDGCSKFIHNESTHGCKLSETAVWARGVRRRIKIAEEQQRRAVA